MRAASTSGGEKSIEIQRYGTDQHLPAWQFGRQGFGLKACRFGGLEHIGQPVVPRRAVGMGDNAIGLAMGFGKTVVRGDEDGEHQPIKRGKAGVDLREAVGEHWQWQMGEDREGHRVGDVVGQAGKVEIGVLDQVIGGKAGFVGQFHLIAALEERAGEVGRPVMVGLKIGHEAAAEPERACPDVKEMVLRLLGGR